MNSKNASISSANEIVFDQEGDELIENEKDLRQKPPRVTKVTQSVSNILEDSDKSNSTATDIEDVLNCLKYSWDVKCAPIRGFSTKEENVLSKGIYHRKSDCVRDYDRGIVFGISRQIPIVHVKGCDHDVLASINACKTMKQTPRLMTVGPKQAPQIEDDGQPIIRNMFLDQDENLLKFATPYVEQNAPPYVELQGILNCVLPPVVTVKEKCKWIQEVSREPSRRAEVIKLAESIELTLRGNQCKTYCFDPIRRKLFDQLFDELIRQETIVSRETGLFLCHIRSEIKMTLAAWENLATNANTYSSLQALESLKILTPLRERIQFEEEAIFDHEERIIYCKFKQALVRYAETKVEERHVELRQIEIAEIQAANKCLKEIIKLLAVK